MEQNRIPKVTTRQEKTWETEELDQMNLSRGEAQHAAKDRNQWRELVETLCPIRDEEEYVSKEASRQFNLAGF